MCYLPSVTAAAAVCLSQAMFGYPAWVCELNVIVFFQ